MRRYPWVVLAAGVATWDIWLLASGHPTLSETFATAVRHPVRRWPTIAAWGFLSWHLFGFGSHRYDPIHRVAGFLSPTGRIASGAC